MSDLFTAQILEDFDKEQHVQNARIEEQELTDRSCVHNVVIEEDEASISIAAPDMKSAQALIDALADCGVLSDWPA
jgi:flagellar hook-basal body complex protein FliE